MSVPAHQCDVCHSPGFCCKGFELSMTFWADEGDEGVLAWLAQYSVNHPDEDMSHYVPISDMLQPTWQDEMHNGRSYVKRRFNCTALSASGRCTIYETRPGPCRRYQAGTDPLCVMFRVREALGYIDKDGGPVIKSPI